MTLKEMHQNEIALRDAAEAKVNSKLSGFKKENILLGTKLSEICR